MIEFLSFCLDEENECLLHGEQKILLAPKVYALLKCLCDKPGKLITHEELAERLWPNTHVQPGVLKSYVRDLRAILDDDARKPRFIETLHRRGYRFVAPVSSRTNIDTPPGNTREVPGAVNENLKPLLEIFDVALRGEPQVAFITGEIGIGKTTLCNRFEHYLRQTMPDVNIIRGHCVGGFEAQEPYFPILEALGSLLKGPRKDAIARALAEHAPTWFLRFPALANHSLCDRVRQSAAGASTESMLRELSDAIEQIARDIPLLIVIDDAHSADPHTVAWIGHIARHKPAAKLIVVATLRKADLILFKSPLHILFRRLVAYGQSREIQVKPLSEEGIRDLFLERSADTTIPKYLVRFLYNQSEGNPLFALAILEHLLAANALVHRNDRWDLTYSPGEKEAIVPDALGRMLETFLDDPYCTEDERSVLEAGSVCGISWTSNVVACVTNMDPERVEDISMGLARRYFCLCSTGPVESSAGVVSEFRFQNSIYRQVLYVRIGNIRRVRLYKQIHRLLELMYERKIEAIASQLVYHAEMSRDDALLAKDLVILAESHFRRSDFTAAASALERAKNLLPKLSREEAASVETRIRLISERVSSLRT